MITMVAQRYEVQEFLYKFTIFVGKYSACTQDDNAAIGNILFNSVVFLATCIHPICNLVLFFFCPIRIYV